MKISKEKILDSARVLFNQKGLAAVTARVISAELKISPGSFSYHFPDKRRLIIELYRAMNSEMQEGLNSFRERKINISTLLDTFQKVARIQLKYKFFFLNLFQILKDFPAIKQLHMRAIAEERVLARKLFMRYKKNGTIISTVTEKELKSVLRQNQILFAYWVVDSELGDFSSNEHKIWIYTQVCCASILPFLTENSKIEYQNYFKKYKK